MTEPTSGGTGGRPPGGQQSRFERPSQRPAGVRPIGAPGHMGVDYEERVDFGRLRDYRLARVFDVRAAVDAISFLPGSEYLEFDSLYFIFQRVVPAPGAP